MAQEEPIWLWPRSMVPSHTQHLIFSHLQRYLGVLILCSRCLALRLLSQFGLKEVPWAHPPSAPGWCRPSWKIPSPCYSIPLQLQRWGNTSTIPSVETGTSPWWRKLPIFPAYFDCSYSDCRHDHTSIAISRHQLWPWFQSSSGCRLSLWRRPGCLIGYHEILDPCRATQKLVLSPACRHFGSPLRASLHSPFRPKHGMDECPWWGTQMISKNGWLHFPRPRCLALRPWSSARLHRGTSGLWSRFWSCWCQWPWRHIPSRQAHIGCSLFPLSSSSTCNWGLWSKWSCRTWIFLPIHLSPFSPWACPQWSHRCLTSGLASTCRSCGRWPVHHRSSPPWPSWTQQRGSSSGKPTLHASLQRCRSLATPCRCTDRMLHRSLLHWRV